MHGESNSAPLGGGVGVGVTREEHVRWMEALTGKVEGGAQVVVKVRAEKAHLSWTVDVQRSEALRIWREERSDSAP